MPALESGGGLMKTTNWMRFAVFSLAAMLALLGAGVAAGQDVTATITGTVTDPSGAPVAGATVTAHDVDRGTNWTAQTGEDGLYTILRVPIGNYELKVT